MKVIHEQGTTKSENFTVVIQNNCNASTFFSQRCLKNIIPNYVNINTPKTYPAANYTKISVQKTLYLLNYHKKRDVYPQKWNSGTPLDCKSLSWSRKKKQTASIKYMYKSLDYRMQAKIMTQLPTVQMTFLLCRWAYLQMEIIKKRNVVTLNYNKMYGKFMGYNLYRCGTGPGNI